MSLFLTLLGTGTPTPRLRRAGSSYLVTLDEERLLFDCGPFAVHRLLEAGRSPVDIDHLFFTHLHFDHCTAYGHLVLSRWDEGPDDLPDLVVYGPTHTQKMTELLFGAEGVYGPDIANRSTNPARRRPEPHVREVADGAMVETGKWRVRVAEVVHCQPELTCLAYRLEAGQQSIVFGGDTAPTSALTELAQSADVLIHMCHFLNGEETNERVMFICSGHLDAARTARDANVGTLILTHLTGPLDAPGVDERILREVRDIFAGHVIVGEDLMEISMNAVVTV